MRQTPKLERMYFSKNYSLVQFVYNLLIPIVWFFLRCIALFNEKLRLFVLGRKKTFQILKKNIKDRDNVIWIHAASLGEYEQGLPILQRLKKEYPNYKILLTFFSPSGFEVAKDKSPADIVAYLPLDSLPNVKSFLKHVNPTLAIFIKYEIWPNYLRALQRRNIPTLLISALFSKRQIFFKPYGGFMRKSLKTFHHFFVQDENSKALLKSIGIENSSVSGDTRFDRVSEILQRDNHLDFMETFKQDKICFVAGSTWPEDEKILVEYINTAPESLKFVLAPHTMKPASIEKLERSLSKSVIKFSALNTVNINTKDVIIIDTIGLLTKIYSYANIAYVGGGFATGLHNTLEPAVFGIPVIIGPQYNGFNEAKELVLRKGIHSINDRIGFDSLMNRFLSKPNFRKKTGKINAQYILESKGATTMIMEHIKTFL